MNDPINRIDPSGHFSMTGMMMSTAIVVALAGSVYNTYYNTWDEVGGVFKGYGNTLNPIMWYQGMTALYALATDQGLGSAGSALLVGIQGTYTNWLIPDDPVVFGESFGAVLGTIATMSAPFARTGSVARGAAAARPATYAVAGRGNTGRFTPKNLNEQLALREILSDPTQGNVLKKVAMSDKNWPASEGWVKM